MDDIKKTAEGSAGEMEEAVKDMIPPEEEVSPEEANIGDAADEAAETAPEDDGAADEAAETAPEDDDVDDFDDFNDNADMAAAEGEAEENADDGSGEKEEAPNGEQKENKEEDQNKTDIKEKLKSISKKLPWKPIGIGAGVLAGVCAVAYFGGTVYYNDHFYPGTQLGNFDCSNLTAEEAEAKIKQELEGYTFTLNERDDRQEVIYGTDIDLKCESVSGIDQAKENQNPFGWVTDKDAKHQPVEIAVSFDEDKLWHIAEGLECTAESTMEMDGATAGVYYQDGAYHMNEVENKNIISFMKLFSAMRAGIYGTYHDMSLEDEGIYVLMADEDHLKKSMEEMNRLVSASITYVKGDQRYVVNGDMINAWVQLNPDYSVTLDDQQISDYVAVLAKEYNTIGSWREFKASSGNIISVGGGDYGWQLDQGEEIAALKNNILAGDVVEREPVYYKKAFEGFRGTSDIPSTYVEVSIAAQHMWYYKEGSLVVSSDCVTGIPNAERMTHTGVYYVKYKERNATLKGANYESKVSYWMPFNGGEGLHDAPWRGVFGGSIYKSSGSHGCVNLPVGVAATLFSNISAGTPVIVY